MYTVGYVISHKNNENRRALFPDECAKLKYPGQAVIRFIPSTASSTTRPATPPAMYPCTTSKVFSRNFMKYADALAAGNYPETLQRAVDIECGRIVNPEIRRFREERGLFCE